ncbi:hypothetical protein Gotur_011683 [Gossypium turneri]
MEISAATRGKNRRMKEKKKKKTSEKVWDEIPPLSAKEQLKSKWDDEDIDDSDIKES